MVTWQRQDKGGAYAFDTGNGNAAMMPLHHGFHEYQTEADAVALRLIGLTQALKTPKQPWLVFIRNSIPLIDDVARYPTGLHA